MQFSENLPCFVHYLVRALSATRDSVRESRCVNSHAGKRPFSSTAVS